MITTRSFVIGSLFTVTIALVMLGVIMVLSSSFMEPNVYEYMGKQLIWFSVGLAAMFYFFNTDFNVWEGWSRWILLGTLFLLALVFFFPEINGARRWIRFAGFTFQPSDLAKLSVIFYLSAIWADREDLLDSFKQGVFWPLSIVGFLLFLIVLEPDHGTTFFIGMISMAIWFIAGGRFRHMVPIFVALVAGVLFALFLKPNLWVRLDAFLRPELYETTKAYQLKNSLIGFANGGLWGVGIGEGEQKLGFTPEPHTDYIFSTLGEELGFVKCALVLGAFACIIMIGYLTAIKCTNPFGRLLAVGCTTSIGLQTLINVAVVTGCMPTTGIPLPFISYGGSSLVISMAMVGVIASVAKETFGVEEIPIGKRKTSG